MTNKNNKSVMDGQELETMDFDAFLKSVEDMEPEEARSVFQNIIAAMEKEGEPVPFSLRLLTTDVIFGVTETPFGLIYGIGGLGQLMLTGFISEEDIEELESVDCVLEEIMDDFKENFSMVTIVRDDNAIGKIIKEVLEGNHTLADDIFEAMDATELQSAVWRELTKIPYGQTISYEELASRVGKPKAVRAVASAVGENPLCLVIPCHRVILKSREIGQYYWGADIKKKLLAYEQAQK